MRTPLNGRKLTHNNHPARQPQSPYTMFPVFVYPDPNIIRFIAGSLLWKTVTTNKNIYNIIANVMCHHI